MANFRPINRDTGFLLPPSVDEWLPERHLPLQQWPDRYPGRQFVHPKRWLGKFGQSDKWISCLTAAMLPRIGSEHDETHTADA